jgi:hypothetical protein
MMSPGLVEDEKFTKIISNLGRALRANLRVIMVLPEPGGLQSKKEKCSDITSREPPDQILCSLSLLVIWDVRYDYRIPHLLDADGRFLFKCCSTEDLRPSLTVALGNTSLV